MTAQEILEELRALGSESIKKVLRNHRVQEPFFGVRIGDLKKIQKRIKKDYQLALDLYETGNYDAMYLAGLIADDAKMTKPNLNRWAKAAHGGSLESCTVPWVAAGSQHGFELALKWIESKQENVAVVGWYTLSNLAALKDDAELDLPQLKRLLQRVGKTIHDQPNWVRSAMNSFVIAMGTYVRPLNELAVQTAEKIGPVAVDVGNTSCKVSVASERLAQARQDGTIGKKRKTVKC